MVLQKLFPKTLAKINSPINGEISVIEQFGKRKIMVSGLTQSGPIAEKVWDEAIKNLSIKNFEFSNILILGLCGGSLVKLLKKYFSNAKIIGVEIDKIMVDLGKDYLGLGNFKNLEIKIMDASDYVEQTIENKKTFDLIFVDMYQGDRVPKFLEDEIFLKKLKKILKEKGIIVFNRLYYKNHIFEANFFLDKLKKIFNDLSYKKILTNIFISVRDDK